MVQLTEYFMLGTYDRYIDKTQTNFKKPAVWDSLD